MAQFVKHFVQDLTQDLKIRQCGTLVFNADNGANVIEVELLNNGEAATISGSISCAVICSDGSTVPVTNGTYSGNVVTVTLTDDCGVIPGPIGVGIQIVNGSVKTTILKAIYNVELYETDNTVDPGSRVALSVSDLIDDIDTAVASIPADYSDLLASIAPAYSDLTFPVTKGEWCWYNGVLHVANQDILTSESWTAAHWAAVTVGGDLASLKSAIDEMSTATDDDEGKALIAKTVVDGKVTEWEFGNTGFSGDIEKITDFPMSTASTWAGVSKGVFILDAPIIDKSGNVMLEFYNTSTHSSWASVPFWFILYQRTAAGTFTVINKKSVDTPSSTGSFTVNTGWTITDDKIYYIGVWRAGSGYIPYISGGFTTFYKSSAYDSDSDFAVGSTLSKSGVSRASNTMLLNITITPDGKHVNKVPTRNRLTHFSVDDCIFWADLITNKDNYTSCFENTQLGYWKKLHEMFGVCVTLNCFCSDGTHDISDVPDKWADEFATNAYWLKFAFHAEDSNSSYDTDQVSAITASYNKFVTAIIKMTGTPDAIDTVTRLGLYSGTLANVKAIRDAYCGVTGLLTSDDTRNSYYLGTDDNTYILSHNIIHDTDNHIVLIHTMPRLENDLNQYTTLPAYMGKEWENQNTILEFFTHELVMTDGREMQIEDYCNWSLIIGARFGFSSDMVLSGHVAYESRQGKDGTNGKSAYESAVLGGYTGTEQEFNADLAAMEGLADDLSEI